MKALEKASVDFLSHAISCFGICLLVKLNLWQKLIHKGINIKLLKNKVTLKMLSAVKAAFISLERDGIIQQSKNIYYLTKFGRAINTQLGLILMPFDGYRHLIANQEDIVLGKLNPPEKYIDGKAIAFASIFFSKDTTEPVIIKEIKKIKPKMICDLGCGSGFNIINICEKLKIKGIGIDQNIEAIKLGETKNKKNNNVRFVIDNVLDLKEKYRNIELIMLNFVLHDIIFEKDRINLINSYLISFPDVKYFFLTDIVSPSSLFPDSLPGFDYIHGLLGLEPRTYEETIQMIKKSKFNIHKETKINHLDNTFLWILIPKKN